MPGNTAVRAECDCCGNTEYEGELTKVDNGDKVCDECREEKYVECSDCDAIVPTGDTYPSPDGEVCESCSESYVSCERHRCGEVVHIGNATCINDEYICNGCRAEHYCRCQNCREWVNANDSSYSETRGETLCDSCYSELVSRYSQCGEECYRTDDEGNCDECSESGSGIHDYEHKPKAEFQGSGPLFAGWELEIETKCSSLNSELANHITDSLPIYCKRDGSLDNGFEIVSHPMSPEWIADKGNRTALEDMLSYLGGKGCKSHNTTTCGLHVHISRKALTRLAVYKIQKLVYENPGLMDKLSRRNGRLGYCEVHHKTSGMAKKALNGYYADRYEAVNVRNDKTIEIRIFKGTLKAQSFFAAIQFAFASARFCNETAIPEVTWKNFSAYVSNNSKLYPDLNNSMKEREVMLCA